MPLPIPHLQFLILSELVNGEAAGHELRAMLDEEGQRKTGPAFYQLMARLEDAKLVKGKYRNTDVDGQIVRERRYEITGGGRRAVQAYLEFAARRAGLAWEG